MTAVGFVREIKRRSHAATLFLVPSSFDQSPARDRFLLPLLRDASTLASTSTTQSRQPSAGYFTQQFSPLSNIFFFPVRTTRPLPPLIHLFIRLHPFSLPNDSSVSLSSSAPRYDDACKCTYVEEAIRRDARAPLRGRFATCLPTVITCHSVLLTYLGQLRKIRQSPSITEN